MKRQQNLNAGVQWIEIQRFAVPATMATAETRGWGWSASLTVGWELSGNEEHAGLVVNGYYGWV